MWSQSSHSENLVKNKIKQNKTKKPHPETKEICPPLIQGGYWEKLYGGNVSSRPDFWGMILVGYHNHNTLRCQGQVKKKKRSVSNGAVIVCPALEVHMKCLQTP